MSSPRVLGGVVDKLPQDLRRALIADATALDECYDEPGAAGLDAIRRDEHRRQLLGGDRPG